MSGPDVAVMDYGVGNLLSVRRALEHCGATVKVTADREALMSAPRVILPGVGAFANALVELRSRGLDGVARDVAARGIPLLGICLGMQMLLDQSEEFGVTAGLGLLPGRVVPVPAITAAGDAQKIPHIGWNALVVPEGRAGWVVRCSGMCCRGRRFTSCTPSWRIHVIPRIDSPIVFMGQADFGGNRPRKRRGMSISPGKERRGRLENFTCVPRG